MNALEKQLLRLARTAVATFDELVNVAILHAQEHGPLTIICETAVFEAIEAAFGRHSSHHEAREDGDQDMIYSIEFSGPLAGGRALAGRPWTVTLTLKGFEPR
jgi:hypothetical protein